MNYLEIKINEVLQEAPYESAAFPEKEFIKVMMVINAASNLQTVTRVFAKSTWERVKEQGYYIG
ncbi:TPA: hypothetical protein ACLBZX_005126 [Bacillus cereus]|uniref:hypothetical protein n=1 Tax=Bacillus cereus group TaxID=86661 RepID=UPI000BA22B8F|nr:hypothetical protein [Bacillus thuringiensis]